LKYEIDQDVPFTYNQDESRLEKNVFSFNKHGNDMRINPYLNMQNMQKQKQDKNVFQRVGEETKGYTLQHTRDLIRKVLQSKLAYNHKCLNQNMPMLTLKQYLFIFFAETYSMTNLISESIELLSKGLIEHKEESAMVKLGFFILNNYCDENFYLVFEGLTTTMKEFFKGYLDELFANENPDLKKKVLNKKLSGESKITPKEIKFLVSEMVTSQKQAILEKTENVDTYKKLEQILLRHFIGKQNSIL
jgi:hypothetical protein